MFMILFSWQIGIAWTALNFSAIIAGVPCTHAPATFFAVTLTMAEDFSQVQNFMRTLSGMLTNILGSSDQPGPSSAASASPSPSHDGATRRLSSLYQIHLQLFGLSGSNSASSSGLKRSQNQSAERGKGGKNDGGQKREWSHYFVCLAFPDSDTVPSAMDLTVIKSNGLGAVYVDMDENGDDALLHATLLKTFPKLQEAEGYELLRTPEIGTKHLMVILALQDGYTFAYLKAVLNQAKCFIRPIQKAIKIFNNPCMEMENAKVCLELNLI